MESDTVSGMRNWLLVSAVSVATLVNCATHRAGKPVASGGAPSACRGSCPPGPTTTPGEGKVPEPVANDVERYRIPLEGPFRGAVNAKVNIVEFSDFQCPFCSRAAQTIRLLLEQYPNDVRIYFRHLPLPFHVDASLAAEAAMAADGQGKFWEMHDKLFANQENLKRADLEGYARDLGLDVGRFKQDLDHQTWRKAVAADAALASQMGVVGTPNFFINGRPLRGALPIGTFKEIVEDEIARNKKILEAGTPPERLYATLMAGARTEPPTSPAANQNAGVAPAKYVCEKVGATANDDVERKCVPFDGTPRGSSKAPVTIVAFSDFQCPYCSRVLPTLDRLLKEYPDQLRVFSRQNPLPFHDQAPLAAEAALAAGAQGKFWKMHDELFANQQDLERPALEKYAERIGLNLVEFKEALDGHAFKAAVDADLAEARELGVQGTPNFFINGRPIRGAAPYERFKALVDDELARAKKLVDQGTSVSQLYATFIGGKAKGLGTPQAATPPPRPPVSSEVYKVEIDKAPRKGGKEPKITLIEFAEFQCPYCARVQGTLDELLKIYKDDLEIVFRHFPLPFHKNAMPAAIAAVAADQQGKFWEMHDKLFANQQDLDDASLAKYAQEIGLDVSKFKAALASPKTKAVVEADKKQVDQFAVQGTPSFFVNGRAFSGAYPLESFKIVLDEEIKRVDARLQTGTPRGEIYAAIIKHGRSKRETPKVEAPSGEPSPTEIYKAEIKGAPIKGAKDALVTIVQFADFQCPFSSRVQSTIDKILAEYKGKVRVAWRNKPLPFHDKAKPAAIAAMAANQQGKFWPMHAILFKNQQNLDAASLEKYAKAIGLNMTKFKAALQDKKLQDSVEADAAMSDRLGAHGTPAFFINGKFLSGAQPFANFKSRIDEELKHAQDLVASGTPKASIYAVILKNARAEVDKPAPPAPAPSQADQDDSD